MKQKNNARRRDQRRREAFFRESQKEIPGVVILGPMRSGLRKEVSRELCRIE